MEKKVTPKFFYLSAFNIIPAIILGGGLNGDSLALICALCVFVLNHLLLVKLVGTLTSRSANAGPAKILMLFFAKMTLMGAVIGGIYFYNQDLVVKVMVLMIFQLIIQVLSIKNNY